MSGRRTAKKRALPGEFTPAQFASCIENGLNIHVFDKSSRVDSDEAAGAESTKKSPDDDQEAQQPSSTKNNEIINNPTDTTMQKVGSHGAVNTTSNPSLSRVECTNGAMEALRLCHSSFLSTLSTSLGESYSSSLDDARILSENDVMTCMEQMGLSHLAHRAMTSLSNDNASGTKRQQQQHLKKSRKKRAFAGFEGTEEELIAEQERLLSESARRVRTNHEMQGKSEER
ncbi:hypothetical protein ACHAXR_010749 [Thalassiosira sp. AJA248-18]